MDMQKAERLFASADMYQVLGYFAITPTMAVTDGLYGGDLTRDIEAIVGELGLDGTRQILEEFKTCIEGVVAEEDADGFFHRVRKDYTHLYTNPQFSVSTLFQSRFVGNEEGAKGLQIVLADTIRELKSLYAAKGFEPSFTPALRADHMAVQLAFMQALRTNEAIALRDGNEIAGEIGETAQEFLQNYLGLWAADFFREMAAEAEEDVYRFVGKLGEAFIESELAQ